MRDFSASPLMSKFDQRSGVGFFHSLRFHGGYHQVCIAQRGRRQENPLLSFSFFTFQGGNQAGEYHAGSTLDVIVEAADLVAILGQVLNRVGASVLKVDANTGEHLLRRLNELLDELIHLAVAGTWLTQPR